MTSISTTSPRRQYVVLGVVSLIFVVVVVWRGGDSDAPAAPEFVQYWGDVYRRGELSIGQEAPDFSLTTADGQRQVQLSSLRGGKPVVLCFGSHSCPNFRALVEPLQDTFDRFHDSADFYFVYIREAHPVENGAIPENSHLEPIHTATSHEQRVANANTCVSSLRISMPVLVDALDNRAADAYRAWPERVYVIDCEGKIAYKDIAAGGTNVESLGSALRPCAPLPQRNRPWCLPVGTPDLWKPRKA